MPAIKEIQYELLGLRTLEHWPNWAVQSAYNERRLLEPRNEVLIRREMIRRELLILPGTALLCPRCNGRLYSRSPTNYKCDTCEYESAPEDSPSRLCKGCPHSVISHGPMGCSECACKLEVDV